MQLDFHYYATYCAATIAGYSHEESSEIAYSAQFVDCCSVTVLDKVKGPKAAATTQTQIELADARPDIVSNQNMTRIWTPFHFLPYDLYAEKQKVSKLYRNKFRLICGPNGDLLKDTVELAKGESLQAAGIAMHVLADTWAHRYFAGTPSLVINNTTAYFYELLPEERKITFRHNPKSGDDLDSSTYTNSVYSPNENSIMNLGHGRAGHLPDYSFIKYKYLPAWGDYDEIIKDNPSDYMHAFCQMIYALKYLKGDLETFEKDTYDFEAIARWEDEIRSILTKRQVDASGDWKAFAYKLTGQELEDFDIDQYQREYIDAADEAKDETEMGRFMSAAIAQKSMVTSKLFESKNMLAGIPRKQRKK